MSLPGRAAPDSPAPGPDADATLSERAGLFEQDARDRPRQSDLVTPREAVDCAPPGALAADATPRRLARSQAIATLAGGPPLPDAIDPTLHNEPAATLMLRGSPPAVERAAPADAARFPSTGRDTYEIAGKFAQGGIGRILRAHDPVLDRTVALKELLVAGRRTDEERFVREVLLTARLQHPGIVPVYAAGRWPSGEPFYAMKLVSGRSFDQVLAEARTLPARLALLPHVLAIAETVAYAHAQGIIHRDLKPNNVLVGEFGETVVIDWGLAKQLGGPDDPADSSPGRLATPLSVDTTQQLTHVGAIVGTPGYMSPEQADSAAVDARTDVYALGVILYQTLSGELPYIAENAVELLFKTVYDPPLPLQRREPQVPEELTAIVEKAMARDPAARYPHAKAFADDLRRYQTGQIVGAHRYTAWELLRRALRRYRASLAAAAIALVIVIVTLAVSFSRIAAERDRAIAAEADALVAESAAQEARRQAEERADTLALEQARLRVDTDPAAALDLLHRTSPAADWRRIRQIAAAVEQRGIPIVLHGHQAAISRAVFSPDNQRLATTSDDCTLRVWDLSLGTSRAYFGHTDEVWRAAWSRDQRRVATTSRDRSVRVWDLASGAAQVLLGHEAGIRNVVFSADGRTLYSADDDRVLRRWDLATGTGEAMDRCLGSSFAWDERQIACLAEEENAVHVHDLRSGERTVLPAGAVQLAQNGSTSPDGRWVAAGTVDSDVLLWDRASNTSQLLNLVDGATDLGGRPREIRFAPNSLHMLVPMAQSYLAAYDLQRGTTQLLRPHTGYTRRANFSPDGDLIASVGGDIGVHLWDATHASTRNLTGAQALMIDVQFSPDGHYLAAVGNDPRVFLWPERVFRQQAWRAPGSGPLVVRDAPAAETSAFARGAGVTLLDTATLRPRLELDAPRPLRTIALTRDATVVAGIDEALDLRIWDGRTGALLHARPLAPARSCDLAPAPAGRHLVLVCDDSVRWADLGSGEVTSVPAEKPTRAEFAAGSDDLLVGDQSGALRSLDLARGQAQLLHRYQAPVERLTAVPGRPWVIAASDRVVDLWDLERRTSRPLSGHTLQVNMIHASADGRRAVTSGRDNVLRVFDLDTGATLYAITPTLLVSSATLSDDGQMLAASAHDGAILLWDLGGGPEARLEPRVMLGHDDEVQVLRFAADGRSLLTIDRSGRAIRWTDALPRDPAAVRAWVAAHHDPLAGAPAIHLGCVPPPP